MIAGVQIIPKRKLLDERGGVYHMLKRSDPEFVDFGEIYFSKVFPGVVKAWNFHKRMILNYFVVIGEIRFVLYDDRPDSSTKGMVQEIRLHESESPLVIVPPLIWNGFQGVGTETSIVANCSSIPHDPQESLKRLPTDPSIPFRWS